MLSADIFHSFRNVTQLLGGMTLFSGVFLHELQKAAGELQLSLGSVKPSHETELLYNSGLKQVLRAYTQTTLHFKQICTAVVSQLLLLIVFQHFPPNSENVTMVNCLLGYGVPHP